MNERKEERKKRKRGSKKTYDGLGHNALNFGGRHGWTLVAEDQQEQKEEEEEEETEEYEYGRFHTMADTSSLWDASCPRRIIIKS